MDGMRRVIGERWGRPLFFINVILRLKTIMRVAHVLISNLWLRVNVKMWDGLRCPLNARVVIKTKVGEQSATQQRST